MKVALLTAAGVGSRMGQDVPKQFLHIHDKPVIVYTMEKFQNSPLIDAICVVTLPHWRAFIEAYAKQFGITKLRWLVHGGETGQESIRKGLEAIAKDCDENTVVMIHDGNRCMVSNDIISDSISTFEKYGSAVAAVPCTEAVFRVKSNNGVQTAVDTIPREELVRTQTPHTYTLGKLLWAHKQAVEKGITNTAASCMLMYQLGEPVYFSKGSEQNFKLTTMDDVEMFKALLVNEKSSWEK